MEAPRRDFRDASPRTARSPCAAETRLRNGRFERLEGQGTASGRGGGLGRPREVRRGVDHSPRGVTWDPPAAPIDGRPGSPMRRPQGAAVGAAAARPAAAEDFGGSGAAWQGSSFVDRRGVAAPAQLCGKALEASPSPSPMATPSLMTGPAYAVGGYPDPAGYDAGDGYKGALVPCPDCGRKFIQESLEKHMRICKKVFLQKRKQFSSAASRLGDLDNANELIANAQRFERDRVKSAPSRAKAEASVPEWKRKSLSCRAAILAAKAAAGDPGAAEKADVLQRKLEDAGGADADMTRCPHCGRTFNKEAGERHIAICVKTFGTKPGGGRLIKGGGAGGGRGAVVHRHPSSPHAMPETPSRGAAVRTPSAHVSHTHSSGYPSTGSASQRRPSIHRSRASSSHPSTPSSVRGTQSLHR